MNYQTPTIKGGKNSRGQNPNGSTIAHRYITDKIQSQIHVPLGYCDAPNSDKCVCLLSPTSDNYWVELGFINNCKEPQL